MLQSSTQSIDYDAMFTATEDFIFKCDSQEMHIYNLNKRKKYNQKIAGGLLLAHRDKVLKLTQQGSAVRVEFATAMSLAFAEIGQLSGFTIGSAAVI